jgi:5-methylcytosine-specific restriction endonuclease McrA
MGVIQYDAVQDLDLSQYSKRNLPTEWEGLGRTQKTSLARFVFEMKPRDVVYVKSGPIISGKGIVEGPYYFDSGNVFRVDGHPWQHQRKIRWLDVPEVSNPTNQNIVTVKPLSSSDAAAIERQYDKHDESVPRTATESDMEGLRYEVVAMATQRSRKLRDAAMKKTNGICAVCDRDFSKLLDGRGIRVLQVHHKKMLRNRRGPSETKLADLVVVCANCHLLIHLDPKKSIPISKLRRMLVTQENGG